MFIDISYCSKKDCKNYKCCRNQKNIPEYLHIVSMTNFENCEYWEDKNGR